MAQIISLQPTGHNRHELIMARDPFGFGTETLCSCTIIFHRGKYVTTRGNLLELLDWDVPSKEDLHAIKLLKRSIRHLKSYYALKHLKETFLRVIDCAD